MKNEMQYTIDEIKTELFDKCHDLVFEYMSRHAKQIPNESFQDFHTRYSEVMERVWMELAHTNKEQYKN
jgi:broad specificity phosphatase PhoE